MSPHQLDRRLEKDRPIYDDDNEDNASPETLDTNDDESGKIHKDASRPYLAKILSKQGDSRVLFADEVLKFTGSGKMKRRILLITDFAIYMADPDTVALKRRIALAAVEKLALSELGGATKSGSDYELDVLQSNRFEYHAAAVLMKEVQFEEVEGGVKTRIVRK